MINTITHSTTSNTVVYLNSIPVGQVFTARLPGENPMLLPTLYFKPSDLDTIVVLKTANMSELRTDLTPETQFYDYTPVKLDIVVRPHLD